MTTTTSRRGATTGPLTSSRLDRGLIAAVRIGVALMWMQNAVWKRPPDFGNDGTPGGLFRWTNNAVEFEVFGPWAWLVENLVLPNFTFFGYAVMILEISLGAFLLIGLLTRFWALLGVAQTVAISLSALNAPHEWHWAYLFMLLLHVALFATAAGRYAGLDGVLRPSWQRSGSRLAPWLERAS